MTYILMIRDQSGNIIEAPAADVASCKELVKAWITAGRTVTVIPVPKA